MFSRRFDSLPGIVYRLLSYRHLHPQRLFCRIVNSVYSITRAKKYTNKEFMALPEFSLLKSYYSRKGHFTSSMSGDPIRVIGNRYVILDETEKN